MTAIRMSYQPLCRRCLHSAVIRFGVWICPKCQHPVEEVKLGG